ncbi:hypothetical protein [Solirubrobacter soli]|uniref:hypothetical protein n=1 Tax=Solirubrobacter soli TaxID=363832 RepID=UPI00041DBE6F|nr:hypothetical protein [Solirubrobacter soli]
MELEERYQSWVDEVVFRGAVWIIGEGDRNTVIEDPNEDRDLNVLFSSRADAERHRERGRVFPPIAVADLPELLDFVAGRGEGVALWHGDRWIVADPAPLAAELRERAG